MAGTLKTGRLEFREINAGIMEDWENDRVRLRLSEEILNLNLNLSL